jgi:hypothetical protein
MKNLIDVELATAVYGGSDIVKALGSDEGLDPDVDDHSLTNEVVLQDSNAVSADPVGDFIAKCQAESLTKRTPAATAQQTREELTEWARTHVPGLTPEEIEAAIA